jgi:eukaryotic-like serine/threonine-protein kinase
MSHMTEHIGRVVGGRYRLLAPLGSGASAEVYLGDDVRLRRRVAVKVLHTALADDEAFLRRFRAEAQAAAALSHPNIVSVYDWNGDEPPPYIVSEYLGAGSLRSMLDAGHRLSPSQALVIGLQTAQALDHAHRQGFVHRDIKPANLLFGTDGRLRIADFGLARAVAEAGWTEPTGAVLGTARYASPEQVRGEALDGRSDVYSLALLLIETVTGTVPFSSDTTIGTLMGRLDKPLEVPEELGALAPVIARAGDPDASRRPDAATLVNDFMDAATELPRPADLPFVGPNEAIRRSTEDPQDRTMLGVTAMPRPPVNGAPAPPGSPAMGPGTARHMAVTTRMPPPPGAPGASPPPGGAVPPMRSGELHPVPRFRWRPDFRAPALPVIAVAIAVLAGVVGAWGFFQLKVPTHEVPQSLIGAQINDVYAQVSDYGWKIKKKEVYRDGTVPGEVVETNPAPGSSLREGGRLTVTVSLGQTLVPVPADEQLAGMSQPEAQALLGTTGLELVAEFVPTASEDVDEGQVIGLDPATPDMVSKGSTVKVLVSSGPPGIVVPDMKGWDQDDAEDKIDSLGLDAEVKREPSTDVDEGKVVRTEPAAGTEAERDGTVTLVISSGDSLEVPDVTDMSVDEAREELESVGLKVGRVRGSRDGVVWTTDPSAGSEVDPGTSVDLWMF